VIRNPRIGQPYLWNDSGYGAKDRFGMPVDVIVTFSAKAPRHAVTKKDMTALEMVQVKATLQEHYIDQSARLPESVRPGHNVSCTINYRQEELAGLQEKIWEMRDRNRAFAVLPDFGDASYAQAPHLEVDSNTLDHWLDCLDFKEITPPQETIDTTQRNLEMACAGGKCDVSL
jgi:hypothetical protein